MAMRIHVFCSDVPWLADGPAGGDGLRSGQIIRFLKAHGHEVSFSIRKTPLTQGVQGVEFHDDSLPGQLALLQKSGAQAAYYCNPMHSALTQEVKDKLKIKVFFDVHGPVFLDEAMWMAGGEPDFFARFGFTLALADEVTVIADHLIAVVQTALAAIGQCWTTPNVVVLPLELDVAPLARDPADEPLLLCTSPILPWQDPTEALEAIAQALASVDGGYLLLINGPHNPPQRDSASVAEWLTAMESIYPQFKSMPFMPPEALRQFYGRAWAIVDLFVPSVERQMAFSPRTWEHLALGLPVLAGGGAIGKQIAKHQAGWVVDAADPGAIAEAVGHICGSRDEVLRRSANAPSLVNQYVAYWRGKARFRHL